MDWVGAVREFHEKFSVPCADAPTPGDLDRRDLRFALIEEEVKEFADACCEHDVIEMADALADNHFTSPSALRLSSVSPSIECSPRSTDRT